MITVLEPGALTTVQDNGRVGWGRHGVPPSGPMDAEAFAAANRLVGNPPGAAGLEITLAGPVFVAGRDCLVAVCGAAFELWAGDVPVPRWHAIFLRRGHLFRFGRRLSGARAFLAVDGGIAVPRYLGSRSTYLKGGFGGLNGRALRTGDRLPIGRAIHAHPIDRAGARWAVSHWRTAGTTTVRVVPGPQDDHFSREMIDRFLAGSYAVTTEADRMGIRLRGPQLDPLGETGIVSDGIVTGSIQVPADGQPIVMMVDHQTTGGYPKIATVVQADVPRLAQCLPGDEIRFVQVTLADARSAYREYVRRLVP